MPLLSRLSSREKREGEKDRRKRAKRKRRSFLRREARIPTRGPQRGCVRAPPSSLLSLRIRRCSWLDPWAKRRGPYEERGEHEEDEGAERGTQTGRSERGTRGCHGYRRIPASPRCHGDASLSLSVSLSFTSFACPLSVSLVHPESSRPFPSTVASRAPLHPPRLPSLRVSPRRRANSAELLSTSPAHSLIFSLRAPWDEEEERAGEIKRNARAR